MVLEGLTEEMLRDRRNQQPMQEKKYSVGEMMRTSGVSLLRKFAEDQNVNVFAFIGEYR